MLKDEKILVAISDTELKLKRLLSLSVQSSASVKSTKEKAYKLIENLKDYIRSFGAEYSELSEKAIISLVKSFNEWYVNILSVIRGMALKGNLVAKTVFRTIKSGALANTIDPFDLSGETYKRLTAEYYRKFMTNGEYGYSQMIIDDYRKQLRGVMSKMTSQAPLTTPGPTRRPSNDVIARRVTSLRANAELEVRHQAQVQDLDRLNEQGVKLVMCSQHINASTRCEPYQGHVYSLDGSRGRTKDRFRRPYVPLEWAVGGYEINWTNQTKSGSGKGKGNGLLGYNCRHRLFEYLANMDAPNKVNPTKVIAERNVEQKLRAYENRIRQAKMQSAMALTKEDRKLYTALSVALQREYVAFAKENARAYYPWRCVVSMAERESLPKTNKRDAKYQQGGFSK